MRELENAIERAVILAENQPNIRTEALPPEVRGSRRPPSKKTESEPIATLAEIEKHHILAALEKLGGNRKKTARTLGIGENTFYRRLKTYGIAPARKPRRRSAIDG